MKLRTGKFLFRIILSMAVFIFGVCVFFLSSDSNVKIIGYGMVTTVFGTWMSSGSISKKPKPIEDIPVQNPNDVAIAIPNNDDGNLS